MPRYTINGVEVPVNQLDATTSTRLANMAVEIAAAKAVLEVAVDKDALQRGKDDTNTKMLVVGAGVVGLLAWIWHKRKK